MVVIDIIPDRMKSYREIRVDKEQLISLVGNVDTTTNGETIQKIKIEGNSKAARTMI